MHELFWGEDMLNYGPILAYTAIIRIEVYLTVRRPFLAEQDGGLELYEKLSSGGGTEIDDVHGPNLGQKKATRAGGFQDSYREDFMNSQRCCGILLPNAWCPSQDP